MNKKNIPQRTCIACRSVKPKQELVRIVKATNGQIVLDKTGKLNGRGAYICNSIECATKCKKTKALNRTFGQNIDELTYDSIIATMKEE